MKIFGAMLIVFACGGAGILKAGYYGKKPSHIRKLRSALQCLENEISWAATPLPEALSRTGDMIGPPVQRLFQEASENIANNFSLKVGESWERALLKCKKELAIGKEEFEILKSFGYSLGNSFKEEQIKNLSLTREHLKSMEKKAEAEKAIYEKLYRTMGFLLGAAVALILI